MEKIQFVFQGGGARLVPLIACAQAAQALAKNRYTIEAVAGTSAGAIVAAALALGYDMKLFRQKFINAARTDFDNIVRPLGATSLWSIVRGKPLYNTTEYKLFLSKILKSSDDDVLSENSPELFIYAADIRNGNLHSYRGKGPELTASPQQSSKGNLLDMVYHSSALPFIFSTHKDKSDLVDGGILRNFPTNDLVLRQEVYGDVLGFTFEPQFYEKGGLLKYMLSLVGTVVDHSVKHSKALAGTENFYEMKTKLGMLSFDLALEELADNDIYGAYRRQAESFIEKFFAAKELKAEKDRAAGGSAPIVEPDERSRKFITAIADYHRSSHQATSFTIKKRSFRFICRTLAKKQYDVFEKDDELHVVDHIIPHASPMTAYGMRLYSNSVMYDPIAVKISIQNLKDRSRRIAATSLAIPPTHLSSADYPNVMVFFHEPISFDPDLSEEENTWEISYRCVADEPMSYLAKGEVDHLQYGNDGGAKVEELYLVCDIPDDFAHLPLNDVETTRRESNATWAVGRPMSPAELEQFGVSSVGYSLVGWRAAQIGTGEWAGFEIDPRRD
jgi:predicted acylesterase/phospholipase RssA